MKRMKTVFLALLLSFGATSLSATEDVIEFDNAEQERLYRQLVLELRCPKCQNQNIADSNAVVAKDMRHKTVELIKQGNDKQQVVDYMVNRYGQFAHYQPPVNIATSLLWLLPLGFALLAFVLLWRRSRQGATDTTDITDLVALDQELDALLHENKAENEPMQPGKEKE